MSFSMYGTTEPLLQSVMLCGWYQILKNAESAGFARLPQKSDKHNVIFLPLRHLIKLQEGLVYWSKYMEICLS